MKSVSALKSNFQLSVESNPRLDWVCFTLLYSVIGPETCTTLSTNQMQWVEETWVGSLAVFQGGIFTLSLPAVTQEEFLVKIYSVSH